MQTAASALLFKNAIFMCYIFSYYCIIIAIVSFFFFFNIRYLRYISELSFYSNYAAAHFILVLALISLAGLPPLFFFFSKLSVVAFIVLQGSWYLSIFALLLIFWGWFIYLNGVRAVSVQSWSFFSVAEFASRYTSTGLSLLLIFFF